MRNVTQQQAARQSFRQEAESSWLVYQKTGRHLTAGEVVAWLDTLGTDDEWPLPECHGASLNRPTSRFR
jgi:predicted transcriptional regulator